MHDIEIAVQRGRARTQKQPPPTGSSSASSQPAKQRGKAGLEIQLRQLQCLDAAYAARAADDDEDDGGGRGQDHHHRQPGLLSQIKEFNGCLERALGVLEEREREREKG